MFNPVFRKYRMVYAIQHDIPTYHNGIQKRTCAPMNSTTYTMKIGPRGADRQGICLRIST